MKMEQIFDTQKKGKRVLLMALVFFCMSFNSIMAIAGNDFSISVTKNTTNQSGPDKKDGTFSFTCTQVTSATDMTAVSNPLNPNNPSTITITTSDGTGTKSFDFTNAPANTYYFKIAETDNGTDGWTYDGAVYMVKAVVANDGTVKLTYAKNTGTDTWPAESAWTTLGSGSIEVSSTGGAIDTTVTTGEQQRLGIDPPAQDIPSDPNGGLYYYNAPMPNTGEDPSKSITLAPYDKNGYVYNPFAGAAYCLNGYVQPQNLRYDPDYDMQEFDQYILSFLNVPYGKLNYNGVDNYKAILWLARNGFMSEGERSYVYIPGSSVTNYSWKGNNNLADVQKLLNNYSLTAEDAYAATYRAIAYFKYAPSTTTNDSNALALIDMAKAAVESGQVITQLSIGVGLDTSNAATANGWYGPVKVNVSLLPVDFTDVSNVDVTIMAASGMTVSTDTSGGSASLNLHSGDEFYVNVGSAPASGTLATATATLNKTVPVKDVYVFCNQDGSGNPQWLASQPVVGVAHINRSLNLSATATLSGKVTPGDESLPFTNTYNTPANGKFTIPVTKTITGDGAKDGTFNFTCTQVTDATGKTAVSSPLVSPNPSTLAIATSGGTGAGSFDFSNVPAGTYYFKIEETDNGTAGWTYDGSVYMVKAVVASNSATMTYAKNTGTDTWPAESSWTPLGPGGVTDVTSTGGGIDTTVTTGEQQRIGVTGAVLDPSVDGAYKTYLSKIYTISSVYYIGLMTNSLASPLKPADSVYAGAAYCLDNQNGLGTEATALYPTTDLTSGATSKIKNYQQVTWVLRNGFMSAGNYYTGNWNGANNLAAFNQLTGNNGLSADQAFTVTQYALWYFANNSTFIPSDVIASSGNVRDAYNALIAAANNAANSGQVITDLKLGVSLDISNATMSGDWYGPVTVGVSQLPVDFTDVSNVNVTITAATGATVSTSQSGGSATLNLHSGDTFYVNVSSFSASGSTIATAQAALNGTYNIKDVFIFANTTNTVQPIGGVCTVTKNVNLSATATLSGNVTPGDESLPFTNTYKALSNFKIPVTKNITGVGAQDGTFNFTCTQVTSATDMTAVSNPLASPNPSTLAIATSGGTGAGSFDFTNVPDGTYYFKIEETGTAPSGWTYDTEPQIITIHVPEDGLTWEAPKINGKPLGSANDFSVVAFGDVTVNNADVESGMAVKGNFTSKSSQNYLIGLPRPNTFKTGAYPIAPHDPRLLVMGNIATNPNGYSVDVVGGSIVVSDTSTPSFGSMYLNQWEYTGSNPYYDESDFSGSFTQNSNIHPVVKPASEIQAFFNDAETSLKSLSQSYNKTAGVYGKTLVCDANNWNLDPAALAPAGTNFSQLDTIIFNVHVATTATIYDTDITLVFPAGFDGNFVVNTITGNSTLEFATAFGISGMNMGIKIMDLGSGTQSGGITYDGTTSYKDKMAALRHDWSNRILWNFPNSNVATITSTGFDFIGSVLAPYSNFAGSGYGTGAMGLGAVNGTLVCKTLTQSNGWEAHNTTRSGEITFRNKYEKPTYNFEFKKIYPSGIFEKGVMGIDYSYNAIYSPLADAEFTLYTQYDSNNPSNPVETVLSDQNGVVKFTGLAPGQYYVQETSTLTGFYPDSTVYGINIDGSGNGQLQDRSGSVWNINYNYYMVDLQLPSMPNTVFNIYKTGSSYIYRTAKSDKDGKLIISNIWYLPSDAFYVEADNNPGVTIFTLTNNQDGTYTATYPGSGSSSGKIYQYLVNFMNDVAFYKYEKDTDNMLPGAVFTLYASNDDGATLIPFDPAKTATSIQNGTVDFYELTVGTYYMKETTPPAGYENNNTLYKIEVLTMSPTAGSYKIYSKSASNTWEEVYTPFKSRPIIYNEKVAQVVIGGTKIVSGDNVPPTDFTFHLTQLNSANPNDVIDPASPNNQDLMVNTGGAGTYDFEFKLYGLADGEYWFKVMEDAGSLSGWDYDKGAYIVKVVVTGGVATVTYPGAGGGDSVGTPSTVDAAQGSVNTSPYAVNRNNTYYGVDQTTNGIKASAVAGIGDLTIALSNASSKGSEIYLALCSEYDVDYLTWNDTFKSSGSRDGAPSALAYALISENLGGLADADFINFLALPTTYAAGTLNPASSNWTNRANLTRDILWMYEFIYKYSELYPANAATIQNVANITTFPLTGSNPITPPKEWTASGLPTALKDGLSLLINNYFVSDYGAINLYNRAYFVQAVKMIREMMTYYDQGITTSLTMSYAATDANSGTLTLGHDGFVPYDGSGKRYDMHLSWPADYNGTVTATQNGVTINNGDPVKEGDVVVTFTGSAPEFTLVDDAKYLKAGSIKGDYFTDQKQASLYTRQSVMVGDAKFVTLQCTLTPGAGSGDGVTFHNSYASIKAHDDYAQTKPGVSVNIDVTDNDDLLPDPGNPTVPQVPTVVIHGDPNELSGDTLAAPKHGTATVVFKDKNDDPTTMPHIQYMPEAGFEGIDEFEYEIWYPDSSAPTDPAKGLRSRAKVYVLVLDDDRITCSDAELIELSLPAGATYSWYNAATGGSKVFTDNKILRETPVEVNHYVDSWIEVTYLPNGATTSVFPNRYKVRVRFVPKAMKWNPGDSGSQDYNDPANWTNWTSPNGNTSTAFSDTLGFVPWGCTDVLIADLRNTYPDLTVGTTRRTTVNDNSGEPICYDIWFEHGGEIAHPDLLTYHWSNVELDMNANEWYMFSAPLRDFYTGDIYLTEPCPYNDGVVIYTQLYNRVNPEGRGDGGITWTGNFNTADHFMAAGEGVSIWADVPNTDYDNNDSVLIPQKYWTQQPYTCFENGLGFWFPKVDTYYKYYWQGTNNPTGDQTETFDKTYSHRFIFESCSKNASTGDITVPVSPAVSAGDMIIVGNPFMSHLDIEQFFTANNGKIESEYKVIQGFHPELESNFPVFQTYKDSAGIVIDPDGLGNLIAPMQSIILTAKTGFNNLTFNGKMTVNVPGNKLKVSNLPEVVTITASMGNQTNTASLFYSPGASNKFVPGEDSYKLYTENILDTVPNTKPLVVYTSSSDGFPLEVNTFGNTDENIKLGIRTSLTGEIELDFSGIEGFISDRDIFLRDLEKSIDTNLKEKPFYTFTKETDDTELKDRFLLVFSAATGLDNTQQGNAIVIYSDGNRVEVASNNDLLNLVQVFDLQGRLLQVTSPLLRTYSTTIDHPGVYVIKAQSENSSEVKKVIIGQ